LLDQFRLCRADVVAAIGSSDRPPHPETLRELSQLQLVIIAIEQVIRDKQSSSFVRSLENQDDTDRELTADAA
jgi:hypothetical protein